MLMEVKSYFKLIWTFFKFNLSAAMEYRVSFIVQVAGMMINNASFLFFWTIIFAKTSNIGGYTMKDLMLIWALSSSTFGFAFVVFGNITKVTNIIINGDLDTYLLHPRDVYTSVLCTRSSTSAWGDFLYGFVLIFILYGFNPSKLSLFILFTVLGGILTASFVATAHALTLFIGNASAIANSAFDFAVSFTIYPDSIYNNAIKVLLYTILPGGFIVFFPYRIFKAFSWSSLGILVLIDLVYVLFGYWFFNKGLKNYESGNLITTKM